MSRQYIWLKPPVGKSFSVGNFTGTIKISHFLYRSWSVTHCCGIEFQNATQAPSKLNAQENTFDLDPSGKGLCPWWKRTLSVVIIQHIVFEHSAPSLFSYRMAANYRHQCVWPWWWTYNLTGNLHPTPGVDHSSINTTEVDAMLGTRYSPLGKKLSQQQHTINHVEYIPLSRYDIPELVGHFMYQWQMVDANKKATESRVPSGYAEVTS